MSKIYIAGAITGLDPDEVKAKFAAAAAGIERKGHTPLDPYSMVDQTPGRHYNEYLLDALRILLIEADAVYFLPDWCTSKGAMIEQFMAAILGIKRYVDLNDIPFIDFEAAMAADPKGDPFRRPLL